MTAELVRGQNHPLPDTRLEIRLSAGVPVAAGALLADADGRVTGPDGIAHPGSPRLPGVEVSRQAAARHRLAVDLEAVPAAVHRVSVLLALPAGTGGPDRFGAVPAPFTAVTGLDGTEIASFTLTGLESESAVVALELYRRRGAWKVRAVGQGYADGLTALLQDQGLEDAAGLARGIDEAVTRGLSRAITPPSAPDPDRARHDTAPSAGMPRPPGPGHPPPGASAGSWPGSAAGPNAAPPPGAASDPATGAAAGPAAPPEAGPTAGPAATGSWVTMTTVWPSSRTESR
ncbi:TerD family protein, partial [Streptomyces sp. MUM 203J]|uniref:TerD family protein n=1 Tax=Streptomyces sp. MUM 203J TaxID=2791990 RepID=UPI001F038A6D